MALVKAACVVFSGRHCWALRRALEVQGFAKGFMANLSSNYLPHLFSIPYFSLTPVKKLIQDKTKQALIDVLKKGLYKNMFFILHFKLWLQKIINFRLKSFKLNV